MIAIHFDERPHSFSARWIDYCKTNNIAYKLVDCYSSNFWSQMEECDGLMWHWYQGDLDGIQFARQITTVLEKKGKKVFPDSNTCWFFDDKISQHYLFGVLGAKVIPTYIFYKEEEAINWINTTSFPKVFKLKGGAGSVNVKLVRSKEAALALTKKAFGKGFPAFDKFNILKDSILTAKRNPVKHNFVAFAKAFARTFIPTDFEKYAPWERGYVYFQDFLPNNEYDTRLIIIGNRCFGLRRYNRDNDFRASGSGKFGYKPEMFDPRCIKIAFETSDKLKSQSMAYDFIMDTDNNPVLVEMSYCFAIPPYEPCEGYWDKDLVWHENKLKLQHYIVEDFSNSLKNAK